MPGPGQYDNINKPTSSTGFRMGKSQRGNEIPSNTVGPGAYSPTKGSNGPKYSIGIKTE
jgi:Sperm-tail PG-rich repeat